jgi:hypothetical protein
MRKVHLSRRLSARRHHQPAEQRAAVPICEEVAELRGRLSAAIERLSETVGQTERILVTVPRLLHGRD